VLKHSVPPQWALRCRYVSLGCRQQSFSSATVVTMKRLCLQATLKRHHSDNKIETECSEKREPHNRSKSLAIAESIQVHTTTLSLSFVGFLDSDTNYNLETELYNQLRMISNSGKNHSFELYITFVIVSLNFSGISS